MTWVDRRMETRYVQNGKAELESTFFAQLRLCLLQYKRGHVTWVDHRMETRYVQNGKAKLESTFFARFSPTRSQITASFTMGYVLACFEVTNRLKLTRGSNAILRVIVKS
jgi:hypothetical protein